jgi:putative DNA primase/helicase
MDYDFDLITEQETAEAPQVQEVEAIKVPIVPVPRSALPLSYRHPEFGVPSEDYAYSNAEGGLVGYIGRFRDEDGNKHTRPLTYCRSNGRDAWRAEGLPSPSPLYNLKDILDRPDAPVLVVRGERNVEVAKSLLPQFVATTSAMGDSLMYKADWSPLKDRRVIVLAHADDRQAKFIETVANQAYRAGAATVRAIPPEMLARFVWDGGDKLERFIVADGWDLADAERDGWTTATLADEIGDINALDIQPKALVWDEHDKPLFRITSVGLEAWTEDDYEPKWLHIAGFMEAVAEARTPNGDGWTKIFRIINADGQSVEVDVPLSLIAGDGAKLRELLHDHGLYIRAGKQARELLLEFVASSFASERITRVDRVGWFDNVFVTTRGVIGAHPSSEDIRSIGASSNTPLGRTGGSLEAWQEQVARPCQGNSRLVFALSTSLCGPLLKLVQGESAIFHIQGKSTGGKSTTLSVAGSTWGGGDGKPNVRSYRATANGLEGIAASHNDALLCLDEISQIKGSEVGQVVYMLTNGQGKQRSGRSGEARDVAAWRIMVLSSGEIDLETKIREDDPKRNVTAGQMVRVINIAADAGQSMGVFEELHGFGAPRQMAEALNRAALENYGHAGIAFVRHVSEDFDGTIATVNRSLEQQFSALNLAADVDGQVLRVAKKFMLVGAAGELAISFGLLPWPEGEAAAAAQRLFKDWLDERGGSGAREDMLVLDQVRYYLQRNASRILVPVKADDGKPQSVATGGFIKEINGQNCFCFPIETWKRDVCAGIDPKHAARVLDAKGFLVADPGRTSRSVNYIAKSNVRVVAVKDTILTVDARKLPMSVTTELRKTVARID